MSKFIAEYVWIDHNHNLRSKARTLKNGKDNQSCLIASQGSTKVCPDWNFDGSSTGQAEGKDSEVILRPQSLFNDPFRGGDNVLVMCDLYLPDGNPHPDNTRYLANDIFSRALEEHPWFGLEQEYFLTQKNTDVWNIINKPLGFPDTGFPKSQGQYYCSVGINNAFGRPIVEQHYDYCLKAGINVSGINAEVAPGQWEFQVGPCEGIEAGDHLWMARYILHRLAEMNNVGVTFDPKPVKGDWNGSGCHTNYSTQRMRDDGGIDFIREAISKLEIKHNEHMEVYGSGNENRLTGEHETARFNEFSYGVANREASIRIGRDIERTGKGYFEDRRPAANMDPYLVTSKIFETTCLYDNENNDNNENNEYINNFENNQES